MRVSANAAAVLLLGVPVATSGQFLSAPPLNAYPNQQLVQRLQDGLAQELNLRLTLPRQVLMTSGDCGLANAFFRSDNGEGFPQITFCSEMVTGIVEEFQYDGLSQAQFTTAVSGTVAFVLIHEVGHALVNVLDLPVLGREEDAADGLGALLLADDPESAYWAAEYWRQKDDFGDTGLLKMLGRTVSPFFDEHGLDEQRYYNLLCWVYGADPSNRDSLGQRIPSSRASRCPQEYQQLKASWAHVLGAQQFLTTETVAATPFTGTWTFFETLAHHDKRLFCQNSGSIRWGSSTVRGAMIQSGTCQLRDQAFPSDGQSDVLSLTWSEPYLAFEAGQCRYEGWLTREAEVGGVVTCQVSIEGDGAQLTGTWRAQRDDSAPGIR